LNVTEGAAADAIEWLDDAAPDETADATADEGTVVAPAGETDTDETVTAVAAAVLATETVSAADATATDDP